jgi:hypothetical protein
MPRWLPDTGPGDETAMDVHLALIGLLKAAYQT